jgi:replicative DNA helicase
MTENINKCLLAAILNEQEFYDKAIKNGNIFLDNECRPIFHLMSEIKTNNKQIIIDWYQKNDPEKIDMFLDCYNYFYDREQFKNYYDDVLATFIKLKFHEKSKELIKDKTKSTIEVKQEILKLITDVSIDEEQEITPCQEILVDMVKNFGNPIEFTPSGIDLIDKYGGYRNSMGYVVIASRPSIGKTSVAINMIIQNFADNLKVGFFSMEEDKKSIISGMACSIAGIEERLYNMNMLNNQQVDLLTRAFDKLHSQKLYIDDTAGLDIDQLKRKARIMKYKYGVDVIYLDYLQLLKCLDKQYKGSTEQVSHISHEVKILSRELNIPIVALAQLNRENDKDQRLPKLSDLKNSGSIEQDADIVILLHTDDPADSEVVKLMHIVAKFRKGGRGVYYRIFDKKIRRISKQ